MNDLRDLKGKHFFRLIDLGTFQCAESSYFFHWEEGQKAEALFHFDVFNISPVLVKIIWARLFRIKPQSAFYSLSHLNAF